MAEEAYLVGKEPCPECGSKDNLARYSDGHGFCFGTCQKYFPADGDECSPLHRQHKPMHTDLLEQGEFKALNKRGISEETCRKFGYTVSRHNNEVVQIANYRDDAGVLLAQKVRFPNKDFKFLGNTKEAGLYGQHLCRDGGKMIVITEGEIDCLSVSQAQGNKWPVVSIPNGAAGARKALSKHLDFLSKYESVVLMFDMDEPGRKAAVECAAMFKGRGKIANLPEGYKDANELLQAGKVKEIIDAIWGAKVYRPEGLVTLSDIKDRVAREPETGLPWWLPALTKLTYGRRLGEIYCFGAGTGVGKTDWLTQQIQFDNVELKEPLGIFFLEQQPEETVRRIAGKMASRRFHIPGDGWTQEELAETLEVIEDSAPLFLYDHFGSTDWDLIREHIRYLAISEDVRLFYIDHLTALAAAEADERVGLERIMAEMGGLVKELNVTIHLVSHLATPEGKSHEEGGRVSIRHFKGSRAIGFWCHYMFGLERDQQSDDEAKRGLTIFRVLKDRYTGQATGQTIPLGYDHTVGLLFETDAGSPFTEEESY